VEYVKAVDEREREREREREGMSLILQYLFNV